MATESSIMDSNSFKEEYASMLSPKTREMISKREKYLGGCLLYTSDAADE